MSSKQMKSDKLMTLLTEHKPIPVMLAILQHTIIDCEQITGETPSAVTLPLATYNLLEKYLEQLNLGDIAVFPVMFSMHEMKSATGPPTIVCMDDHFNTLYQL